MYYISIYEYVCIIYLSPPIIYICVYIYIYVCVYIYIWKLSRTNIILVTIYMYILVEILHTEFQYISLIEMQNYN